MHNELNNRIEALEREVKELRADAKHWKANYHGLLSVSEEARLGEEIRTYERDFAAEKLANAEAERDRLAADKARLSKALRNIAEGNLGDAKWQANYDKIREVARAALSGSGSGWRNPLEHVVEFVAKMAWRTDPPNANNKLSDTERLSAIKYHPTVKHYGKPHIELAEREAAAPQQGGE